MTSLSAAVARTADKLASDGSCQQPAPPSPAGTSWRGWWRLDQASGHAVTDASGNGFTLRHRRCFWASGRGSRVARLDGNGAIATQVSVLRTDRSFSVAAWVQVSSPFDSPTTFSGSGGSATDHLPRNAGFWDCDASSADARYRTPHVRLGAGLPSQGTERGVPWICPGDSSRFPSTSSGEPAGKPQAPVSAPLG